MTRGDYTVEMMLSERNPKISSPIASLYVDRGRKQRNATQHNATQRQPIPRESEVSPARLRLRLPLYPLYDTARRFLPLFANLNATHALHYFVFSFLYFPSHFLHVYVRRLTFTRSHLYYPTSYNILFRLIMLSFKLI